MSHSIRLALVAAVFIAGPVAQSPVRAAGVPADACTLLTPADYKAFGVTAAPKGQLANTPAQTAHACTAGSLAAKPMLSLIVQEIKMPMAVEMGRKALARDGDALTGPWDAGNVHRLCRRYAGALLQGERVGSTPDQRHGRRSQDRAHRDRQADRRGAVGPMTPAVHSGDRGDTPQAERQRVKVRAAGLKSATAVVGGVTSSTRMRRSSSIWTSRCPSTPSTPARVTV